MTGTANYRISRIKTPNFSSLVSFLDINSRYAAAKYGTWTRKWCTVDAAAVHRSTALWETPVGQLFHVHYPKTTLFRVQGPKSTTEHATHVLAAYRASLSSMRAHQVVWEPYRDVLDSLPPYCTAGRHIWRATVPLIYFWIVEDHHPERVFRQFGMKQAPPGLVDTSVELHRISLQGKLETDWVQQHAIYIDRWAHRGERVANAPTLDGDTTYLAAYMAEYRRSTRRYITRESAYWEILVESNVEMLLQCQPGSAMYNQLTKTLDLVGELNRVALDNVRAMASEASTQATTVVGEVVGLEGVDVVEAVEVVEVVLIFTSMTWVTEIL
ncbi:serine/threonine-protein phosphatase 7 long form like protein [Quercus suber]|uniref:Serine/threonine-protein phosphatase 7 long form like protein n=1 Tax=Quercus suber TaxID=58331 RepID=A0AAW0JDT9_QUESU